MDQDTIEIHSYLIRDSALYTLLIVYFLFFLLFFWCIVQYQTIKRCLFGSRDKLYLLPLHSSNLNRQSNLRPYDKYKYTNLGIKRPSDFDSFSNERPFTAPQRPKDRSPTHWADSPSSGQSFTDRKPDLITFPTLSSDASEQDKLLKRKKNRCEFKFKNKRCFNKNCKRRSVLSKIFCKYYSKLRPSSVDQSDSASTDPSSTVYSFGQTSSKPLEDEQSDKELDREKALKCYQDFLENRFCRPGGATKIAPRVAEPEEQTKKKEELKRITDEAANNAKILTPKQLRMYEPFKAEIANPVTKAKPVTRESDEDDAKDLEQCKYVDLAAPESGKDLKKRPEGDFNFLRLADDLTKSKHQKAPQADESERQPSFVKSKKFYLEPERGPTMQSWKDSSPDFDDEKSEPDGFFDLKNLMKNKRTIPDLNEMYKQRVADPKNTKKDLKVSPFERTPKELRPFNGRTADKPGGQPPEMQPPKRPDKTSLDEDITSRLRKELDKARQTKLSRKPDKLPDPSPDELSSPIGKDQARKDPSQKEIASESPTGGDVSPRTSRDERSRKEDESTELAKDSEENIRPLVDQMKSEMKHLKPIEFKPLQTVYLKEKARPSGEIDELKISRVHKGGSRSPSLNSERLFGRNMDLDEASLIRDKPDDLMNLSQPSSRPKDDLPNDPESRMGKVNLNNVLSLKDRQLEQPSGPVGKPVEKSSEKPSEKSTERSSDKPTEKSTDRPNERPSEKQLNRPLNAASIDRQANNELPRRPRFIDPDQFEQIGKIESPPGKPNKLVSVEKAATGKRSRIPLLNDKLKKSKSLTLYKKSLFGRSTKDERVDKDLERMFNLKFKR